MLSLMILHLKMLEETIFFMIICVCFVNDRRCDNFRENILSMIQRYGSLLKKKNVIHFLKFY